MPIRFMTNPLACLVSCGPDGDALTLAVVARPCHFKTKIPELRAPTEEVLRSLVAGRRCPTGRTHSAKRLRTFGLAERKPNWQQMDSRDIWQATKEGQKYIAEKDRRERLESEAS